MRGTTSAVEPAIPEILPHPCPFRSSTYYCRSTSLAPSVTWLFLLYPPPLHLPVDELAAGIGMGESHLHGRAYRMLSMLTRRFLSLFHCARCSSVCGGIDSAQGMAKSPSECHPCATVSICLCPGGSFHAEIGMLPSADGFVERVLCEYHELSRTLQPVVAPYARS